MTSFIPALVDRRERLSPEELLAYNVGVLVMGWSETEQALDYGVTFLRREMDLRGINPLIEPNSHFRTKLKFLRRTVSRFMADPEAISAAFKVLDTVSRLKRVREAAAHGSVRIMPSVSGLRVHLGPSIRRRMEQMQREAEQPIKRNWPPPPVPDERIWDFGLGPSIPFAEFEADVELMRLFFFDLRHVVYDAYRGMKRQFPDLRGLPW